MSEHSERFVAHLQALKERDSGAMAALRHSLAFDPGAYPPAYPYVERFVGQDVHERDARRLALYTVAGLYAKHPQQRGGQSCAAAFGELMFRRRSASIENRFVALLAADAEHIHVYLRQAVSLMAADGVELDYSRLLDDLSLWMNPYVDPERRDRLRQRWARDFYRALQGSADSRTSSEDTSDKKDFAA